MKTKFLLGLLLTVFNFSVFAQTNNAVAVIKNSKESFTQTASTSTTKFDLKCTESEYKMIKAKALELSDRLTLTASTSGKNLYSCELKINNQNHAEYVQKMMMSFGIQNFEFDGKRYSISELSNILKGLNK